METPVMLTGSEGYIGTNLKQYLKNGIRYVDKKLGSKVEDLTVEDIEEVNCIIHLAANTNIAEIERNPKLSDENIRSTTHIVDLIRKSHRRPYLIFSSSSAVHFSKSLYALAKKIEEKEVGLVPNTIFRFYNVVGGIPDESNNDHILPNLFDALSKDREFEVYGSLDWKRDYIYVNDLCKALFDEVYSRARGIREVGTGKVFSIGDVIKKVEEVTGRKVKYVVTGCREGDIPLIECVKPSYAFEEGLTRAVQDYSRRR